MKTLVILVLSTIMLRSCDGEARKDLKSAVIEYHVTTRGYFRHVTAANGEVKVWKDRNMKDSPVVHKLSDAQQKAFVDAFNELNLEEIPSYKAPSEKRFFDGAAIASLTITYQQKKYESQPFDHLNPPAEIERIVGLMAAYTQDHE